MLTAIRNDVYRYCGSLILALALEGVHSALTVTWVSKQRTDSMNAQIVECSMSLLVNVKILCSDAAHVLPCMLVEILTVTTFIYQTPSSGVVAIAMPLRLQIYDTQ